ncbi:LamG-like jellyroll fold domain-containing protein [Streptomyces sp. NPDC089919]|uniref:LamG-like jellyroll fold domain-containing protein n=1 Tax=Streptomyces sp. NPDC089919 TaxID=3155188 RepID=UPI00343C8DA8
MFTPSSDRRARRGRLRRRLVPLPVLTGLILALPALPAAAEAPAPTDPMLAAQATAVADGRTVPVPEKTTEISTVDANPDGTFTQTTSLLPARVRRDGRWVPVDATLAADGRGRLAPKATPNGVTLSAGGDGPLVTLDHADGPGLSLSLPFTLPAPEVSGDTALYADVLPGVDLSVSVTEQGGFSDVLIVRNAEAAANPELKNLRMAADTEGLTLRSTDAGGMTATDAGGEVAYASPQPLMWDSAAPSEPAPSPHSAPEPSTDRPSTAAAPGTEAAVEPVAMTASDAGLTLTPDTSLLSGPDTVYPVYIDPYTNPVSSTAGHYTEVYSSSACDNSPQYDKPQANGQGVGYQRWGGACGTGLERSYWAINTGGLQSSFVVYDAKISIATTYAASWNCSENQPLTLHTTNAISSGTDWLSRPGVHDTAFPPVSTTVPSGANSSSSCTNSTATFNVTAAAQKIADADGDGYDADGTFGAGTNTWTVGLYGDESQTSSNSDYLRMSQSLTLTTRFDIPPGVPSSLRTVPTASGASGACVMSGDGWIGATTYSNAGSNVTLHSTVTSQISGETVRAHYHVWDRTVLDSGGNALDKIEKDTTYLASGTDAAASIGFTLLDGHEYGWDVYAQNNSTLDLKSAISPHCWFKTDFAAPTTPTVATNASFPPVGTAPADPPVYAGPGVTTSFTVTGADSAAADSSCTPGDCLSSGIDHFIWTLDTEPTATTGVEAPVTSTDAAGNATATLTGVPVTKWGVHTLYVAGVDKAGNISTAPAGYTYTVPWNPATKVTPGDISGDGVVDLLATTKTGDLNLIPGDTDPAQAVAPAATGPVTGTAPPVTGPVTVATPADSPDGTGWNNYLVAHRGNLHGADVDDLFAYNKTSKQMYVVKNDLDPKDDNAFPAERYSVLGGFTGRRFDVIPKDPCMSSDFVADDTRCRTTTYDPSAWNVTQLVTPGNVFGNTTGYPAVITVENKQLWIYQATTGGRLKNPLLLGGGDWSGQTLITPGTFQGKPVLWTRDNASGALYSYTITPDPTTGLPPLLNPTVHATLPLTLSPAGYPVVASAGDLTSPAGGPDGLPDLLAVDTYGQLLDYPYVQSGAMVSPPQYRFDTPQSLGSVTDTSNHWWHLGEGTGTAAADANGTLAATLGGGATWATDAARGKVLDLDGATGYAQASGSAVDTSKSHTVSAWVKLDSLAVNSSFVSQAGATKYGSGLQLYYSSGAQVWAFGHRSADSPTGTWRATYSGSKAVVGKWTHLVGVYDQPAQEIRLYVDGRLAGVRDWTYTPWNATGALNIGRTVANGGYVEYANGQVADVRTWPLALSPTTAPSPAEHAKATQLS